jgi:hypothetical protein
VPRFSMGSPAVHVLAGARARMVDVSREGHTWEFLRLTGAPSVRQCGGRKTSASPVLPRTATSMGSRASGTSPHSSRVGTTLDGIWGPQIATSSPPGDAQPGRQCGQIHQQEGKSDRASFTASLTPFSAAVFFTFARSAPLSDFRAMVIRLTPKTTTSSVADGVQGIVQRRGRARLARAGTGGRTLVKCILADIFLPDPYHPCRGGGRDEPIFRIVHGGTFRNWRAKHGLYYLGHRCYKTHGCCGRDGQIFPAGRFNSAETVFRPHLQFTSQRWLTRPRGNRSSAFLRACVYATASLAAFTGRPLITFRAGLALKTVGSLVKGLMPLRSLVAGFLTTTMRTSPGTMKMPFFFSSA